MIYQLPKSVCFKKAFGSRGSQPNFVTDKLFFKKDQVGYEGLTEEFVSQFANTCIQGIDVVKYKVCQFEQDGILKGNGCVCENFLVETDAVELPLIALLRTKYSDIQIANMTELSVVQAITSTIDLKFIPWIYSILLLDLITLNDDRHYYNISFKITNNIITRAPVFDNGAALYSNEGVYSYKLSTQDNKQNYTNSFFKCDYISACKILKSLNITTLKIDANKAKKFITMFSNSVYLPMQVQRCKEVLLTQLSETEGWLWRSV